MFRWIFLNPCDVNDLLDVKLKQEEKGFYSCHQHYGDIVLVYAWSEKSALRKVAECTEIKDGYSLYKPKSPLRHYIHNIICKIRYGGFGDSDTQWLTDF